MSDGTPDAITITWGDRTYTAGDLTATDMIAMERHFGLAFHRLDFKSIEVAAWMVWLVRSHDDPDIELAAVTDIITFADLSRGATESGDAGDPPTKRSSRRAGGSGRSGGRGTSPSSG